jgi:uncharacterized phage protein gp47/JayE
VSGTVPAVVQSGYGITTTGFARMRFPEIRQAIIDDLQSRTGLVFETRPDSITGQFIDTFAEREAAVWELCEAVYFAMYPISAFGTNLDHSVSFAGVRRLFESRSRVFAILYGVENTIITAGALARQSQSQATFLLDEDVTITTTAVSDVTIIVENVADTLVYTVTINGNIYSVTATFLDDDLSITAALATLLNTSGTIVTTNANTIRMHVDDTITFAITISPTLRYITIGSGGNFTADEYGPLDVPIGTLTSIITTTNGWESLNNIVPGLPGRNDETDDELRRRYDHGVFRLGAATLEAIDANLRQNIQGMLALRVFENVLDVVDADGRDPHCVEVVIWGGDARVIAYNIYFYKAAGISTFGSTLVVVKDSKGYEHDIRFNRPAPIYFWVNCIVTKYAEEAFPTNGDTLIEEQIVETGNSFGIGVDVIVQRFHGPIFANIKGIQILDITFAATSDPTVIPPPGAYTNVTAPVDDRSLSRFDASRTTVTVLP